jgi:thioesterase domain-containing protein
VGVALVSAGWLPRRGYHQHDVFFRLNNHMSRAYRPSSHFDGPALVIRSDGSGRTPGTVRSQSGFADLGWSALIGGPITTVEVVAAHSDLLRKPAVEEVAAHVTTALASMLDEATLR